MDKYKQYMNNPEYEFVPYSSSTNKYPNGGNVPNGMANSQLEKQENTLNPDGSTTQFNLPSHNQQSEEEGTVLDPGTLIFSDRLKPKGNKKTFAILNKPNNTDKEAKILEDAKSNTLAKKTAKLMRNAKHKNSLQLFEEQEALKQSKIQNYIKRLGGKMDMYPDGGKVDAQGFPIDITGRRLTSEEQMGFNRPGYTYGNTGVSGNSTIMSGMNQNTGKPILSLENAGGINTYKPQGFNVAPTVVQNANESFEQAYQRTYGKPLYSKGGVIPKFSGGDRFVTRKPMTMDDISKDRDNEDLSTGYTSPWDNPEWINSMKKTPATDQGFNTNWKDVGYQAGMTLANSAGALTYLGEQGKKYDKQNFYNYKPNLLDPTASLRDVENEGRIAKYDLADKSSGHAGNYLSNRSGLAASIGLAKDKVRREFGNINAQIKNQGEQYNIGNRYMTDDINARNKGQALTNYYKAINSLGTNVAQSGRDYKADQRDNQSMDMMSSMFANYKFDPKTNSWIFKK